MYNRDDLYRDIVDNIYRDSKELNEDEFKEVTTDRLIRLVNNIENDRI